MTENVKKFLKLVSTDEKVKSDLDAICKLEIDEVKQAILKLADEHGLTLTKEDLDETEREAAEMSDDEIEAVAGGKVCYCGIAGGGITDREREEPCSCAFGGYGKGLHRRDRGSYTRCACAFVGQGSEESKHD